MKAFFTSSAVSSSSGSAEQPVIINALAGGSAERPVRETAQPVKALRSITDVQWWLKNNEVVLSSSAEAVRIREVAEALSTKPKPRRETVERFFKPWGVPQLIKKKRRPLSELVEELKTKVIVAAKELQQQLADSAERPLLLSHSAEQPVPMDTSADINLDQDPTLTELRARQRKRAQTTAAEEQRETEQQRPHAKSKAANRQKKRTAGTTSGSVEQPASKRQDRCLTAELFAANARDPSEPGDSSSGSTVQLVRTQQQCQRMGRLLHELKKLQDENWVVGDAKIELQDMIAQVTDLQQIPATQAVLRKRSVRALYTSICGALRPHLLEEQDHTRVSFVACDALEEKILLFVQAREEIKEPHKERYVCLWELKSEAHAAMLNGLPDMPRSLQELIQALKDTGASVGAPFGCLHTGGQVKPPFLNSFYFIRMLACLELPNTRYVDLPPRRQHAKLIDKVMQHRQSAAEARAAQLSLITAGSVKDVLQEFASDSFSAHANKRWLLDVLIVPKQSRQDPEYLPQIFETAVDEFLQDVSGNTLTRLALSKHTLAVLALYHRILIVWKKKSRGPMYLGPIFRMLANAEDTSRKQYLPQEQCGEDVELAANRMPAYWTRIQDSADRTACG